MSIATWVGYPRSWTKGRPRPIQYIVVHYTAGSEGSSSAENGAAYDKVRTDGTSTHVFADSNSVAQEVPDGDTAHAALYHGNAIGLQLEICGTAQTREQWLDPVSSATLRMAAKISAEWCVAHDIPVRRLSVAETRDAWYAAAGSRPKGFVGHVDVTNAYPEDGGDHTDPGAAFPWDVFLNMVSEELGTETEMFTIVPDSHGTLWLCNGMVCRPIGNLQEVSDLRYLASKGVIKLWHDETGNDVWPGGIVPAFGVDIRTLQGGDGGGIPADVAAIAAASATATTDKLNTDATYKSLLTSTSKTGTEQGLAGTSGQSSLVKAVNTGEDT